jgi:hypothetical protein
VKLRQYAGVTAKTSKCPPSKFFGDAIWPKKQEANVSATENPDEIRTGTMDAIEGGDIVAEPATSKKAPFVRSSTSHSVRSSTSHYNDMVRDL